MVEASKPTKNGTRENVGVRSLGVCPRAHRSFKKTEKLGNLHPMKSIAVIPKSTTHVYWKAVEAGAREGAKEGFWEQWNGRFNKVSNLK
jgi:ABC-type sugar transport system substrate-binding protein